MQYFRTSSPYPPQGFFSLGLPEAAQGLEQCLAHILYDKDCKEQAKKSMNNSNKLQICLFVYKLPCMVTLGEFPQNSIYTMLLDSLAFQGPPPPSNPNYQNSLLTVPSIPPPVSMLLYVMLATPRTVSLFPTEFHSLVLKNTRQTPFSQLNVPYNFSLY